MTTSLWIQARGSESRLDRLLARFRPLRVRRPRTQARRVLSLLYVVDCVRPDLLVDSLYWGAHAMAQHPWLRPVYEARLQGASPLADLFDHLLKTVAYPLPDWLYASLFASPGAALADRQEAAQLLVHLGQGGDLRRAPGLPVLTRREAHTLFTWQGAGSVMGVVRAAQVASIGGPAWLGEALSLSGAARRMRNEDWWRQAIAWLVDIEPPAEHVGLLLDWLLSMHARHEALPRKWGRARALRASAAWHDRLGRSRYAIGPNRVLPKVNLPDFETDMEGERWSMRPLRSTDELAAEGAALSHCVATYASLALQGVCSLWSLRCDGQRCLTVELRSGRVVQARGLRNRAPTPGEASVLRLWAEHVGVRVVRT